MKVNVGVQCLCVKPELIRGIPNYTIQLLNALKHRGRNDYSVSFFDYYKERGNREYVLSNLSTILADEDIFECNTVSFRNIMQGIRMKDKSVYESKSYGEFFGIEPDLYHLPESAWIPQNFEAPVVVTVHDLISLLPQFSRYFQESYRQEFYSSMKYAIDNKYELIAISENTKKDILSLFDGDEDRIHVIPNGYSNELFYPDNNLEVIEDLGITQPYILYLGALDARKGIREIVNAFETIGNKYDVKLVLTGNIEALHKDNLKDVLEKASRNENIIFTGYVSDIQKRILMSCAELFLFPSEYEGFGLPVIEAMACGTPVITTNVSSIPEAGGDAAIYVEPGNAEMLASEIKHILDDSELRIELSRKGLEHCKSFSWDNTASMVEKVYSVALSR